jgi:acyl carrier protein
MTFSSLSLTQRTSATEASLEGNEVRSFVAKHLKVDIKRITDEAHFRDDLGVDWLDRLELMMLIEDQFAGVEITDEDADQMEVIGDLIRYIEDENVRA